MTGSDKQQQFFESSGDAEAAGALLSRDEMNLAEFPLTVLSTRSNPKIKTLEFSDTIYHKSGKPINRRWTITGADKFGLPTSSDDEVLLGLLKLTVKNGFKDRKVLFTRYELLKILRWSTEGRSYIRLQNALDRLSGVRIKAANAFYDNESKSHSTRNFGLVDAYEINDGRDSGSKLSFFIWSEVMFKSFQDGFIKKVDLDFFLSLKSAVSKRLYRYLDKHFWYKSKVQMNLFTLCHEKLGVSRNYKYPSLLKQQLDVAIEELSERGFIAEAGYNGKGKGTEVYFLSQKGVPRVTEKAAGKGGLKVLKGGKGSSSTPPPAASQGLRRKLEELGLASKQANSLTADRSSNDLERIAKVIEFLEARYFSGADLASGPKNPLGLLYRAVEKPWEFKLPGDKSGEKPAEQMELQSPERVSAEPEPDNHAGEQAELEAQYAAFRAVEIAKFRAEAEPALLEQMNEEAREALKSIRKRISAARFEQSVQHRVDSELAKLFSLKEFSEWLLEQ